MALLSDTAARTLSSTFFFTSSVVDAEIAECFEVAAIVS